LRVSEKAFEKVMGKGIRGLESLGCLPFEIIFGGKQ
jgi:hypothetical protein